MRALWGGAAAAVLALLVACGGGGGAGSTEGDPPASSDVISTVSGTLSLAGVDGDISPAAAGREVRLVTLDAEGNRQSVLASAATRADGTYLLSVPAGQTPGRALAVEADEADGSRIRAFAVADAVDLSPASEAAVQEFFSAATAAGTDRVHIPLARLALWQRSMTNFLELITVHATRGSEAVAELRTWIHDDPSARESIDMLRTAAILPAASDIGGLYGFGRGAWIEKNAAGTQRLVLTKPSDVAGQFDLYGGTGEAPFVLSNRPYATVQFANEGVLTVRSADWESAWGAERVLRDIIGSTQEFRFGLIPGRKTPLMDLHKTVPAGVLDGDMLDENLSYTSDVVLEGKEWLDALGGRVKAWRLKTTTQLNVALSQGGVITSTLTRTDWCVPFVGIVRSETTLVASGPAGTTSSSDWRQLQRGVLNDVSWPGRLKLQSVPMAWPSTPSVFRPLALSPQRTVSFADTDGAYWPTAVRSVDVDTGAIRAEYVIPVLADGVERRVYPSRDGSKLYVVLSRRPPEAAGINGKDAIPLADAAAAGAQILRLDAATLAEEMRLVLPPAASVMAPGKGYARSVVNSFLVSPTDPNRVALESFGVMVLDGDRIDEHVLADSAGELYAAGSGAMSKPNQAFLRAWDDNSNELHLVYQPLLQLPAAYVVPVHADGLTLSDARADDDTVSYGYTSKTAQLGDYFTADHIYVNNFRQVLDKANKTVLGTSTIGSNGLCDLFGGGIVCLGGDGAALTELSWTNLASLSSTSLQYDLRTMLGNAPNSVDLFRSMGVHEAAIASSTFDTGRPLRIYRLTR